jgi:hypothetical protein
MSLSDHLASSGGPSAAQEWLTKLGASLPSWRGMAQALGLRRLQELIQVRPPGELPAQARAPRHAARARCRDNGRTCPPWLLGTITMRAARPPPQGTCSLSDQPAWLLGIWYGVTDADAGVAVLTPEVRPPGEGG